MALEPPYPARNGRRSGRSDPTLRNAAAVLSSLALACILGISAVNALPVSKGPSAVPLLKTPLNSGMISAAGRRWVHGEGVAINFTRLHGAVKPSIGRQSRDYICATRTGSKFTQLFANRPRNYRCSRARMGAATKPYAPSTTSPLTRSSLSASSGSTGCQQLEMSTKTPPTPQPKEERHWERSFTIDLPEGVCVGLTLNTQPSSHPDSFAPPHVEYNPDHWIRHLLHPKEVEYGIELQSEKSRNSFFIGRLAMRIALATASACYDGGVTQMAQEKQLCDVSETSGALSGGYCDDDLPCVTGDEPCILKDEHGRPTVPEGFLGSISHKRDTGVALVAEDGGGASRAGGGEGRTPTKGIGVDIEKTSSRGKNIGKRVLTPNELNNLGQIEGVTRDEEVFLRFSLKECVYKAMHPLINHYVGFQEAEITPNADGTATVVLDLKSGLQEKFGEITANWRRVDGGFFLTSSSVTLRDEL